MVPATVLRSDRYRLENAVSCERPTMILIATMTGERAMDIFLCPQCRTQFSYEHPKVKGETPDVQPVPKVQVSQRRKAVREPM
jgi:hypothetical protein